MSDETTDTSENLYEAELRLREIWNMREAALRFALNREATFNKGGLPTEQVIADAEVFLDFLCGGPEMQHPRVSSARRKAARTAARSSDRRK